MNYQKSVIVAVAAIAITACVTEYQNGDIEPSVAGFMPNEMVSQYLKGSFIVQGGCVATDACSAASFSSTGNLTAANVASGGLVSGVTFVASGNMTAATVTATSTTVPNFTCTAATGEECVTAKRGARIYMDYDNTTSSKYFSYDSSSNAILLSSMGVNAGNNAGRFGSIIRDVDTSALVYGSNAADTAGTSMHFMYHTATTGTNDDASVLVLANGNSTVNSVARFRRESGGLQILGYATASLPTCNSSNLTNSTGTLGMIEYDTTTNQYKYCNGTAWVTAVGALTGSATIDFASIAITTCADSSAITVTGAAAGDVVRVGVPNGAMVTGSQFTAWANATDQVTVRHCCIGAATCDPASGTFKVSVEK